jgi:hypothetical protein
MSKVLGIFSGLQGLRDAKVNIPSTGFKSETASNITPFKYGAYTKAPILFSNSIDYSTRRGVLYCKGITHTVLRNPPLPSAGGLIAPTGIGRHQLKGIAYSPEKPIDQPIMPLSNPFSSGLNNPLGQPK